MWVSDAFAAIRQDKPMGEWAEEGQKDEEHQQN